MLIPKYNTKKFTDVWNKASDFLNDLKNNDIPLKISDASCNVLYGLLYARFGNNPIANYDVNQFKYKIYSTIWIYGGEWERKIAIQDMFRTMSEDDIMKASEGIYNHANNPSVAPSTGATGELGYVDDQTVSKNKKGKLDAYQFLWAVLDSDITNEFMRKFEPCFAKFVDKNIEAVYCSLENDENNEEEED